jgi:hypothetical protein
MPPARSNRSAYKTYDRNVNTVPYELERLTLSAVLSCLEVDTQGSMVFRNTLRATSKF